MENERKILSEVSCGDMVFQYILDTKTGNVGLLAVPAGLVHLIDHQKKYTVVSLVQLKLAGEEGYRGLFSAGRTMTNSLSCEKFSLYDQKITGSDASRTVVTCLKNDRGCTVEHHLVWHAGCGAVAVYSVFVNGSSDDVSLEMMSSFSLGSITPFESGDTPNTLLLHRLRSRWADEGRPETVSIEDLQLEPSNTRVSANTVRFGQTGTMPVREYFPFIAAEDVMRHVSWGAQLAWPGSWQMEAYRKDDALLISGGLADRNFSNWVKKIKPGESFTSPQAILSVAEGGFDTISQRLTSWHALAWEKQPAAEASLPAEFNEWCMTWGGVSAETVGRAVRRLENSGIKYFVMDAGWNDGSGNWIPVAERFPDGLEKTVQMIRDAGFIPGIWFEYECCAAGTETFAQTEHQLTYDGTVITESKRHFWDMRDPYVSDWLAERVIGFLKKYDIGYLKIDYNESTGPGCDGAESPGEGLRQHVEGVVEFLKKIRRELPDLIIENCSSGGHRLEPCMMSLCTVASFSDAHETINIPIVAANLHRAILPCQSMIWAVVRKKDTARRLYYTMAAGLLGRLCLSGDVDELDARQWDIVRKGIAFYRTITPFIKNGISRWYGPKIQSYRHPAGWQGILRVQAETECAGNTAENAAYAGAYAVIHTFAGDFSEPLVLDLPASYSFKITEVYAEDPRAVTLDQGRLVIAANGEFQGFALRMECRPV